MNYTKKAKPKRLLSLLLTLAMVLGMLPTMRMTALAYSGSGGSMFDPFMVNTYDELKEAMKKRAWISDSSNVSETYITLNSDILIEDSKSDYYLETFLGESHKLYLNLNGHSLIRRTDSSDKYMFDVKCHLVIGDLKGGGTIRFRTTASDGDTAVFFLNTGITGFLEIFEGAYVVNDTAEHSGYTNCGVMSKHHRAIIYVGDCQIAAQLPLKISACAKCYVNGASLCSTSKSSYVALNSKRSISIDNCTAYGDITLESGVYKVSDSFVDTTIYRNGIKKDFSSMLDSYSATIPANGGVLTVTNHEDPFIANVDITDVTAPLGGTKVGDFKYTVATENIIDMGVTIVNSSGIALTSNKLFVGGEIYQYYIHVMPKGGYMLKANAITGISTGTINGESVETVIHPSWYSSMGTDIRLISNFTAIPAPVPEKSITVHYGNARNSSGYIITRAAPGTLVTLTADEPGESEVFDYWFVSDDTVAVKNPYSPTTTFIMPDSNVTIVARFKDKAEASFKVSGTVTSFNSDTDDVTIQLIESGASESAYETVVKGNTASYSIEGVVPGTYTMKVMKKNHITRECTITVGTENVTQDVSMELIVEELAAELSVNGSKEDLNLTVGGKVTLVPTVTGGTVPYTYQYLMKNVSTGKTITLKDYSSATSYTGALTSQGEKIFTVNVKDSDGTVVATNTVTVVVSQSASALTGSLKVNGSTADINLTVGGKVTLVPTATGGTAPYTYKYVIENVTTGKTVTLKDYSSATSYTGAMTSSGTKKFKVYVKDAKGTVVETNAVTVVVGTASALTGSLKVNGSTADINLTVGGKVTLVPTATGGTAPYTYKYVIENVTTGKTVTLKDYSSATSYTGTMTSSGTKKFKVYVKDSNGTVVTTNTVNVIVSDASALTASLKVNGSTGTLNLSKGGSVTLVPTVTGGTAPYTYQYLMKTSPTGTNMVLKNYSSATSYTGPLKSAGTKIFTVNVKDSKGTVVATNSVTVVVK